ncbi:MAG: Molybdopterin synthase sulfur carrier subunit, partial [uncultured Nocardioidaceae bacterium]
CRRFQRALRAWSPCATGRPRARPPGPTRTCSPSPRTPLWPLCSTSRWPGTSTVPAGDRCSESARCSSGTGRSAQGIGTMSPSGRATPWRSCRRSPVAAP